MKMNFMLVDDNKVDLYVNQKVIEKASPDSKIKSFSNAISAINYLKILVGSPRCQTLFAPDVILLDINMPELNGFQFINEFNKLKIEKERNIKIYMLSSSTNIEDVKKAKRQRSCVGFINKPLTIFTIEEILFQFKPYLKQYDYQKHKINLELNHKNTSC